MPKLIKLNTDYRDEFDVRCFVVINDVEFEAWKEKLLAHTESIEHYFGSNEFLEWNNGEELFNDFEIADITYVERDMLVNMFPAMENDLGIVAEFGVGSGVFTGDSIYGLCEYT